MWRSVNHFSKSNSKAWKTLTKTTISASWKSPKANNNLKSVYVCKTARLQGRTRDSAAFWPGAAVIAQHHQHHHAVPAPPPAPLVEAVWRAGVAVRSGSFTHLPEQCPSLVVLSAEVPISEVGRASGAEGLVWGQYIPGRGCTHRAGTREDTHMVYPSNGILPNNKKKRSPNTRYDMGKP